jgi:hypothetical protein
LPEKLLIQVHPGLAERSGLELPRRSWACNSINHQAARATSDASNVY